MQKTKAGTVKSIPKKNLDAWINDARAFIAWAVVHHMSNTAILSNLSHDIFGLAIGDKLMLPRVSGYSKEHPFNDNELVQSHTKAGEQAAKELKIAPQFTGSGFGCLLPLLNNKGDKKS